MEWTSNGPRSNLESGLVPGGRSTAKPDVGIVRRFYGGKRVEDEALRDYLLNLKVPEPQIGKLPLETRADLPGWFSELLDRDQRTRELWSGSGKPRNTDRSRSGFDYSLVRRLLWLAHKNIDELATILALRPEGAVKKSGEDGRYMRRTIGNALVR